MKSPRKRDLIELMQWQLNIVDRQHGKWYITREFKDFIKDSIKMIVWRYSAMVTEAPEIDRDFLGMIAMLLEWDEAISDDEAIEAAMFLEYWTEFGVCPFDNWPEPVGVV